MAAVMAGGAAASGPAQQLAEEPSSAHQPLDLYFVGGNVQEAGWADWGETFWNLDDLVARIGRKLLPGQRVRRLVLAAHSADHTSGFVSFDVGFGGKERIDGLNVNPIRPEIQVKLARLGPLVEREGVLELRVCGMGQGDHGMRALRAVADTVGVAVRGPVERSIDMAPGGGLITDWLTVYPSAWHLPPVRTNWLETWPDGVRTVEPIYVPIPGARPRPLPPTPPAPREEHFVAESAASWMAGARPVSGVSDFVDRAIGGPQQGETLRRLSITAQAATGYEGFFAFDASESETIDGSIREQAGYPHLQVILADVRAELERLRPHLAPDAVLELRAARFGGGESGRRAMQAVADVLGVEVRAPASTTGELMASAGLVTRWRAVFPTTARRRFGESSWRELSEPSPTGPWVPVEVASFAPVRGVLPTLPERHVPDLDPAELETALPAGAASAGPVTGGIETVLVLCASCGRLLDEPVATPMRARLPCPSCGSIARRRETGFAKQPRPSPFGRVRALIKRQRTGVTPGALQ